MCFCMGLRRTHVISSGAWHVRQVAVQRGLLLHKCAGVGPEMADALTRRFPTALSLHEALAKCKAEADQQGRDSETARLALISGVQVSLARSVGNSAAKSVLLLCS